MRASLKTILLVRIPKSIAVCAAAACFTTGSQAQIPVSAFGSILDTFAARPPADQWSTKVDPGAATYYGTAANVGNLDPAVNGPTNAASTITTQTANNTGTPPLATAALAQYSTVGQFLHTRSTGGAATFLMASLRNDSGGDVTSFDITYILSDGAVNSAAEITPGHRVYYNLGGAAGNWVSLGDHGTVNVANQSIVIPVALGSAWLSGTTNYLLFVDVNNSANNDMINQLDNFQIQNVVGGVITCPGITNQPQNVTLAQCPAVGGTFSISATGSVQGIQWYLSNSVAGFQAITGANSSSYTTPPAALSDSGSSFRAIVTNATCSATSSVATLTVVADTFRPAPVAALTYNVLTNIAANNLTNVTVYFNEQISATTVNNPDWYSALILVDTNTNNGIEIFSDVIWTNFNRAVILHTAPLDPTHGYTLQLELVFDACAENEMLLTNIPVYSYSKTILERDASTIWKYNQDNADLGIAWRAPGYDDSTWATGAGPFDAKTGAGLPGSCSARTMIAGEPIRTCLSLSNATQTAEIPTYYFRKQFTYTGDTNVVLQLRSILDDGMVVYLNGVELLRYFLPNGTVGFTTAASRTVGDGRQETNYAAATLINGVNTIAVEVHNVNLTGSDLTFALAVDAISATQSAVEPVMSVSRSGASVTVSWVPPIGTLQGSSDIGSPANWFNIPGATSPFTTNAPPAIQFFRVTVP